MLFIVKRILNIDVMILSHRVYVKTYKQIKHEFFQRKLHFCSEKKNQSFSDTGIIYISVR